MKEWQNRYPMAENLGKLLMVILLSITLLCVAYTFALEEDSYSIRHTVEFTTVGAEADEAVAYGPFAP